MSALNRNPELETLLDKLFYFEKHPEEKKRNKEDFYSICGSVEKHYNSYLDRIEELMGKDNILDDGQYLSFRETAKQIFGVSGYSFKDVKSRMNHIDEKQDLRKLRKTIEKLNQRYDFLEEKLQDPSLEEEERKRLEQEFDEVSERLYYIDR